MTELECKDEIVGLLALEFGDSYPLVERVFMEKAGLVADEILRIVSRRQAVQMPFVDALNKVKRHG